MSDELSELKDAISGVDENVSRLHCAIQVLGIMDLMGLEMTMDPSCVKKHVPLYEKMREHFLKIMEGGISSEDAVDGAIALSEEYAEQQGCDGPD